MRTIKEYIVDKKEFIKNEIASLEKKPKLVIVQVNDDPASNAYIRGKLKDSAEVGFDSELIKLPETTTEKELLDLVKKLNHDDSVTGFIVQMPLPKGIDEEKVKRAVTPSKDIDGFNPLSDLNAATPQGIVTFLKDEGFEFKGKNAVVFGRSNIVGRPMARLLLDESMNVTVVHSKTSEEDKKFYLKHADLIVLAVGKIGILSNNYELKSDAVVIDVGINRGEDGKLHGDALPDLNVGFQTPVPGGVGLLTRLALLLNLLKVSK